MADWRLRRRFDLLRDDLIAVLRQLLVLKSGFWQVLARRRGWRIGVGLLGVFELAFREGWAGDCAMLLQRLWDVAGRWCRLFCGGMAGKM